MTMDGVNGTKSNVRGGNDREDRPQVSHQVAGHIRRLVHSDRFHQNSAELHDDLKERLAALSGLPRDHIQICSSIGQGLEWTARIFCNPGDKAVICGPEEHDVAMFLEKYGVKTEFHFAPSPFSADIDGIVDRITDKTRLIYLEQPNSVTGTMYSRYEIEALLNASGNIILVVNESCRAFSDSSVAGLVRRYDNLIILRSIYSTRQFEELPVCYILSSRNSSVRLNRYAPEERPSLIRQTAAAVILNDMANTLQMNSRIHDTMIYMTVRLRGLGITARMTPGDSVLIRVVDPGMVASLLTGAGLMARSLRHLKGLEYYLSLTITDETSALRAIEVIDDIPRRYLTGTATGRTKLTLRRTAEEGGGTKDLKSDTEKNKEDCTVQCLYRDPA